MADTDSSSQSDTDSSSEIAQPQHFRIEVESEEGDSDIVDPKSMSIVRNKAQMMSTNNSPDSRPSNTTTRNSADYGISSERRFSGEDISIGDVKKQLSHLRVSAEKSAIGSGRRGLDTRFDNDDDSPIKLPARAPVQEFIDPPGPLEIDKFFKNQLKKVEKLATALNNQQMFLFERQAEILQLRMSVVQAMMKFETDSKFIKADLAQTLAGDLEEILNASWPKMSDGIAATSGQSLYSSWPSLDPNWNTSHRDSLSFAIHTILEELPEEGSESTSQDDSSGDDTRSRNQSPMGEKVPENTLARTSLISNRFAVLEPDDGRLSFPSRPVGGTNTLSESTSQKDSSGDDTRSRNQSPMEEKVPQNTLARTTPASNRLAVEPEDERLSFPSQPLWSTKNISSMDGPSKSVAMMQLDELKVSQPSLASKKTTSSAWTTPH
jgi:hypothetical protein